MFLRFIANEASESELARGSVAVWSARPIATLPVESKLLTEAVAIALLELSTWLVAMM